MAPHGLRIGAHGAPPELGDVKNIVNQLKALPSGFKERKPEVKDAPLFINRNTIGGQMEAEAIELLRQMAATPDTPDEMRLQAIEKQLAAASAYESEGKQLEQVVPMCNAAFNYLALHNPVNADGELNAEKAVALYQKALPLREETPCRAYRILCDMYTALAQCCEHGKADQYGEMLKTTREKILHTAREQQGGVDENAHRIEEGEFGYSDHEKIGTDNISQCITIIAQDPHTLKTGLAHVDNFNDITSLDAFFAGFGEHRLNIRLIGARFTNDQRTDENLLNTMEYLSYKNADIISADIYDNDKGPSAVVVEPNGFKLTEKVPAKSNLNELPSNAMHILTRKGKPLIQQFDYTVEKKRQPIHMNARVLKRLREKYFGNPEWEIDAHLKKMNFFDRPLVITHLLGMEQAYHEQWDKLNAALEAELIKHGTGPADSEKAREALLRQTFYVGENATEANAPLYDWIENKLFVEGRLQRTQLEGPTANDNVYDPPAPPEVPEARGFRRD